MIKINHGDINFHPTQEQKQKALRKIRGFNFIKHNSANLIVDSSHIEKSYFVVYNENPYLLLCFLDRETLSKTRMLIGAYDVFTNEDLGCEYIKDEILTKKHRTAMVTHFGSGYKKALIKTIVERRESSIKNYNNQIEEIERMN